MGDGGGIGSCRLYVCPMAVGLQCCIVRKRVGPLSPVVDPARQRLNLLIAERLVSERHARVVVKAAHTPHQQTLLAVSLYQRRPTDTAAENRRPRIKPQ